MTINFYLCDGKIYRIWKHNNVIFLMSYNNAVEFSILIGQAAFLVLLILIERMELPSCIWPLDRRSRVRITTITQPSMIRSQWSKITHVLFGWTLSALSIKSRSANHGCLGGYVCGIGNITFSFECVTLPCSKSSSKRHGWLA